MEINVRAWDDINKRMLHSGFFIDCDGGVWYDRDPHGVDMSGKRTILAVYRLIPMLYTGLKDKNGIGIYDGDIVKCGTSKDAMTAVITFKQQAFLLRYLPIEKKESEQVYDYLEGYRYFEVIGNIYQTELKVTQP